VALAPVAGTRLLAPFRLSGEHARKLGYGGQPVRSDRETIGCFNGC
jgi:hypothetical protein